MRIAIAGASGTGKTTLAVALAEQYDIPLNPVGSRSVAKSMGFDNPYDVDKAGKREAFQLGLFNAKQSWEMQHEHFVTDRCYLDNLTYCAMHMIEHVSEAMADKYIQAMDRYDAVFFLPMKNFQRLDDGIRQTNPVYHQVYESTLRMFIAQRNDQYANRPHIWQLAGGTALARTIEACDLIELIWKLPLPAKGSP